MKSLIQTKTLKSTSIITVKTLFCVVCMLACTTPPEDGDIKKRLPTVPPATGTPVPAQKVPSSLARPKKPGKTTYCACWCYWKEGNDVHWGVGQYIVDPGSDGLCHNGGKISGCTGEDGKDHTGTLDFCQPDKLHPPDYRELGDIAPPGDQPSKEPLPTQPQSPSIR